MKKLLRKISYILCFAIVMLGILSFLSTVPMLKAPIDMMTNSVPYQNMGKGETLGLWQKIGSQNNTTKLVLGDSVANQLYEYCGNDEYFVMTGNMAMTIIWQYIFVRDYLEMHPDVTDVYLCISPSFLDKSFETSLSYSYLLIPLVETGNIDVLEEQQYENLQNMYGSVFMEPQMVRYVGASGLNTKVYLNFIKKFYEVFPKYKERVEKTNNPDIVLAEEYIMKIYELCKQNKVILHLIPNPQKDIPQHRSYLEKLEEVYSKSLLYQINPEYFNQIVYYPESCFKDELHFKDEYLEDGGKYKIIRDIQNATGELKGIIVD